MKRKNNGLIVGTVLVVLIGALIILQARNQEPAGPHAEPTMPGATAPGSVPPGPRVEEHLDTPPSQGGAVPAPGAPPQ